MIDSQFFDAKRLTGVKLKDYVAQFDRDSEVLLRNTNRMLDLEENGNVQVESEEEDDGNDGNQMFEDEEEFDDNDQEFDYLSYCIERLEIIKSINKYNN